MCFKGTILGVLLVTPLLGCRASVSSTAEGEHFRAGLQCHWADRIPGDGLIEKTVLGTAAKLYLHPEILLTESDVESATAFPAEEGPAIMLQFTAQGQEKMARLASKSEDRLFAIVVDGVLITAPKISGPIAEGATISGISSMAEAKRLARRICPPELRNQRVP
jgi:preprotein translocase subunit SecD